MATRHNGFCAGTSGTKPLVELDGMMRGRRFWFVVQHLALGKIKIVCVRAREIGNSVPFERARSLLELPIAEKIHFDWLVIIIGEMSLAFALHSVFCREAKH